MFRFVESGVSIEPERGRNCGGGAGSQVAANRGFGPRRQVGRLCYPFRLQRWARASGGGIWVVFLWATCVYG